MFKIIAAVIIGGSRTFWGPLLGLLVLTIIQELLRDLYQIVPLIWGSIIIFTMLFLPQGLESFVLRLANRSSQLDGTNLGLSNKIKTVE